MQGISRMLNMVLRLAPLLLLASVASAQCPANDATLPGTALTYPMTSDQYTVQYQIQGGSWTNAAVYISYYGKTDASPKRGDAPYTRGTTSMSFVSIPAQANALVQLRVTRVPGPFLASDHVSVRPTPKLVGVQTQKDGTVQLSTVTGNNFKGEQFILWWNRGADGGAVEGLAFFLNPPYAAPTGGHVKIVNTLDDLSDPTITDATKVNALDFEGTLAIGSTGAVAYDVPPNITTIFLGPNAWVQGKLRFSVDGVTLYGPGVLDGSRFNYLNRNCLDPADGVTPTNDGLYSLSTTKNEMKNFVVDGIVISDQNHAANDPFFSSTVNNVKTIGWNSNNAALRLNDSTTVSNVFIRSSDDSLMIWGSPVSVSNATVWQGYNGGVVSLGWSDNSAGDNNLVDGLWVVKTDWTQPTAQSWTALSQPGPPNPLAAQNNAVIASLMVPSTMYGKNSAPVFRNIFVEDPPQVLFSLKIGPSVNCPPGFCNATFLMNHSVLNLKIENLYSPQSVIENSIGFQTLPAGYIANGSDTVSFFPTPYTLKGTMNIEMTNVFIKTPIGLILPLTGSFDAAWVGKISTNGSGVSVKYDLSAPVLFGN